MTGGGDFRRLPARYDRQGGPWNLNRQAGESPNLKSNLDDVFSRFSGERGDLIPILQEIQAVEGYIAVEAMSLTARFLNIPESTVYGVTTFYAQFYLTPQGRHKIKVCLGTACHVRGGNDIMKAVKRKLGISAGETTEAYEFTLERVACVGSCALAPVVVIDDRIYGAMTVEKIEALLDEIDQRDMAEEAQDAVAKDGST